MNRYYRHLTIVAALLIGFLSGSLMRGHGPNVVSAASAAAAAPAALGRVSINGVVTNLDPRVLVER